MVGKEVALQKSETVLSKGENVIKITFVNDFTKQTMLLSSVLMQKGKTFCGKLTSHLSDSALYNIRMLYSVFLFIYNISCTA